MQDIVLKRYQWVWCRVVGAALWAAAWPVHLKSFGLAAYTPTRVLESQACYHHPNISIITNYFLNNLCFWEKRSAPLQISGKWDNSIIHVLWLISLGFSHNCTSGSLSFPFSLQWQEQQQCSYLLKGLESTKLWPFHKKTFAKCLKSNTIQIRWGSPRATCWAPQGITSCSSMSFSHYANIKGYF